MENKKKILITEDDAAIRGALHDKIMNEGFDVIEAVNGEEGLDLALKEHPDLIICDILMPKMDGLDMLKKIKEDDWGKTVPFIILTNMNQVDQISQAMSLVNVDKNESFEYFVKTDTQISDIVESVKNKLK